MSRFINACLLFAGLWLSSYGLATAQPVAAFATSDTNGCAPITITFTDLSAPGGLTITNWHWDFGDNTISSQQNPVHTYTFSGYFYVTLVVTLSNGTTSSAGLWLNLAGPQLWGVGPVGAICGPGPVNYQAFVDSTLQGVTYQWTVTGPASLTGTGQHPVLTFPSAGTYDVTVVATDPDGCQDSVTQPVVIPAAIEANLTSFGASCGSNDGTAIVSPSGGTPPYFVMWSNQATGDSVGGLWPGMHVVTIFDTLGCSVTDTFTITQTGLTLTASLTDPTCDNDQNGAIDLSVSGGNGTYTYTWSTGATTEDLSGLGTGTYVVTVSDGLCTTTDTFELDASVLDLMISTSPAACDNTGGSATVAVSGGVTPYAYQWSTGATTPTATGLTVGGYSVQVTDASGCIDHTLAFVAYEDTCTLLLSGQVYYDANGNCVFDPGDLPFSGWITLSNGQSAFADSNGYYSFEVFPGSYVVGYNGGYFPGMTLICPPTGLYQLPNVQTDQGGLDFAFQGDSTSRDLRISMYKTPPRPGFNHFYYYHVVNDGGIPISPVITITLDPLVDFVSSNPAATIYNPATNMVSWVEPPLLPGQNRLGMVTGYLDPSVPLGTPLTSIARVDPVALDLTPPNNVDTCTRLVVGSFDPNDKLVTPQGSGPEGHIAPEEQEMRYTIRFQNTGTDTAFFVVIRDTIDTDLDIMTFKPTTWSHPYDLTIEDERVLVFSFPNILLPDSNTHEAASHGHVGFTIQHDGTLTPGTEISNRAAIYFDFNAPIITNTVLNTVYVASTGLQAPAWAENLQVYPNPTADRFVVEDAHLLIQRAEVLDMRGASVAVGMAHNPHRLEMDARRLPAGTYLLRIHTDRGPVVRRLVRMP